MHIKKEEVYKEDEKYERGESNRLFFFFLGVYKCYVYYIFSTLSKQIINDRLLLVDKKVISMVNSKQIINDRLLVVVISRQKSNFNGEFKLEPITTYPLRICCENVINV